MMARTHIIIGWTAGISLLPSVTAGEYTPEQYTLILIGLTVGSLLPDLDSPHSLASQLIPVFGGIISKLTSHRGILHSGLAVVILFLLGGLVARVTGNSLAVLSFWSGMIFGYIGHILADMLTVAGIRLFYPLKFKIRGFITTGGMVELIIRWGLVVISLYQVVSLLLR